MCNQPRIEFIAKLVEECADDYFRQTDRNACVGCKQAVHCKRIWESNLCRETDISEYMAKRIVNKLARMRGLRI